MVVHNSGQARKKSGKGAQPRAGAARHCPTRAARARAALRASSPSPRAALVSGEHTCRTRHPDVVRGSFLIVRHPPPPARHDGSDFRHFCVLTLTDPTHPLTSALLQIAICARPGLRDVHRIRSCRRRALPYAAFGKRRSRGGRWRGPRGSSRRSPSRRFWTSAKKSRSADLGALVARTGLRHLDVRPCRTRPGASAGSGVGGGAARAVACGGRKVAIFLLLHKVYGVWRDHHVSASGGCRGLYSVPRVYRDVAGRSTN